MKREELKEVERRIRAIQEIFAEEGEDVKRRGERILDEVLREQGHIGGLAWYAISVAPGNEPASGDRMRVM